MVLDTRGLLSDFPGMDELIREIEAYCRRAGISPATLCVRAVGNSRLYNRLTRGGECLPRTIARLRRYMAEHPPEGAARPREDAA